MYTSPQSLTPSQSPALTHRSSSIVTYVKYVLMTSVQEKMQDLFGPGHRQIAEIIPNFLYLSDIMCASDDAVLAEAGFTHVISILSAPIPWLGPSPNSPCRVLQIRCDDTTEDDILTHFDTTNAFINEAYRENQLNQNSLGNKRNKVLCHCLAGISRSPTIIAAYLLTLGMRSDEALDFLREKRTVVDPNPSFIEQLAMFEARVHRSTATFSPSSPIQPSLPPLITQKTLFVGHG